MNKQDHRSPLQKHRNSIDIHPYNPQYGMMPSINNPKTKSSNLLLALIDDSHDQGISAKLKPTSIT